MQREVFCFFLPRESAEKLYRIQYIIWCDKGFSHSCSKLLLMLRCHLKNWKLEYYKKKTFSVDFSSSRLLYMYVCAFF